MDGMASGGNSTSTTGPVTRAIRPTPVVVWSCVTVIFLTHFPRYRRQRVGSADDFADLLGDLRLAGLVGLAGQDLMRSSALSVAAFIARRRAACSDAADSSSAV